MKIAIAGTRGIPNQYGGFEQFAERLSVLMVTKGHEVVVYNPEYHPYKELSFFGVQIIRKSCPEKYLKGAAHFYYDYICIKHAIKEKCDAVIVCGYGTSAPALKLIDRKKTKIIVNMDGMEWKRTKYHSVTRRVLKYFEKTAVKKADVLIADHPEIKKYFFENYSAAAVYIPYGADIIGNYSEETLKEFGLEKDGYFLTVARDDPSNQIETIINAWESSHTDKKLLVITNKKTRVNKNPGNGNLLFIEGLYDYRKLSDLRHFSIACIHGHSVGGTNPSLLEAMAAGALIIANDNNFNRHILENSGLFFKSEQTLKKIFENILNYQKTNDSVIDQNLNTIQKDYKWEIICEKYLSLIQ